MAKCEYCGDSIALPYTCSLCGDKHCGKHRLAENHDCINIGTYRTPGYTKKKLQKQREIQQIKSGNDPATGQSMVRSSPRLGSFWTTSSKNQNAIIGGLLLGFTSTLPILLASLGFSFTREAVLESLVDGVLFFFFTLLFGAIGMLIVYQFRSMRAQEVGVSTDFVIWPAGIAISIITSLIGFMIYAFGFFSNDGGGMKSQAEVAKNTIYSFAGLFLSIKIFNIIFNSLYPALLPTYVTVALNASSYMFLIYGLIMMIPWGMLDGSKLYNYNSKEYWIHLAGMIVLLIIEFFI